MEKGDCGASGRTTTELLLMTDNHVFWLKVRVFHLGLDQYAGLILSFCNTAVFLSRFLSIE